jgi:general transcription factor IIIA
MVNANRKKSAKSAASDQEFGTGDDEDDSEDEYVEQPRRKTKKRGEKPRQAEMDDMHGFPDHSPPFSAFEGAFQPLDQDNQSYSQGFGGEMGGEEGREEIGALYDQADIDWELQRRALEGGAFWIGADEMQKSFRGEAVDEWTQEEMEMRRLVGDD